MTKEHFRTIAILETEFWFTRQGHGVGFWDREELRRDMARRPDGTLTDTGEDEELPFLESLGELLSEAARAQGEAYYA